MKLSAQTLHSVSALKYGNASSVRSCPDTARKFGPCDQSGVALSSRTGLKYRWGRSALSLNTVDPSLVSASSGAARISSRPRTRKTAPQTPPAHARARLEAVPQTKQIGYYSDAYKLEFVLPKFAMYKRILAKILAERFVVDRGWSETAAVELGLHSRRQHPQINRLRDVVIGAAFERRRHHIAVVKGGHHDNWNVLGIEPRTNAKQCVVARAIRHQHAGALPRHGDRASLESFGN